MGKKRYLFFIIIVWIVLVIPLTGMIWCPAETSDEKKDLAQWPEINTSNWWDLGNLKNMSSYFEDRFYFRQEMITANAYIRSGLLRSESNDQVIAGKDGWMYFSGDLDDFQGSNLFSDRELYTIKHNLILMKNYIEQQGSQMILTIAPNKATLYGENMPYYYIQSEESNLQKLSQLAEEAGVIYVDLQMLFQEHDEILYFKKDSHWNTKGAVLVYNALMDAMGLEHETYENVSYTEGNTRIGDLEEMLYPAAIKKEYDISYDENFTYTNIGDFVDNMDSWIETVNPEKSTKILMYRDSFGENLIPFIAQEIGNGYFSRRIPYNLPQVAQYQPDYVIIERVERKIEALAAEIPVMEGPVTKNINTDEIETKTTIETNVNGAYFVINGKVDEAYINTDTEIYIDVKNTETGDSITYKPFYTLIESGNGNGYQLYLNSASLPEADYQISVIIVNQEQAYTAAVKSFSQGVT